MAEIIEAKLSANWTAIVPLIVMALQSGDADMEATAKIELTRMAQAADRYVEIWKSTKLDSKLIDIDHLGPPT